MPDSEEKLKALLNDLHELSDYLHQRGEKVGDAVKFG